MIDWESLAAQRKYDDIARHLIADCSTFDFEALRDDTFGTLDASEELAVHIEDAMPDDGCGGGGYYRPEPPAIYLHPSIWRRDNFTLLHELGHHLQTHHPDWGYVLLDLAPMTRRAVEEAVCHSVAAQVLMPWAKGELDSWWRSHPADVMAGLFETSSASRSAVLQRVKGLMPQSAKWILAVADLNGEVQTSGSTYGDAPPAKGSRQAGFGNLALEAQNGPVRRFFSEGVQYSTGSLLDDMHAEAVLDHQGSFVFVALTPTDRFGTGKVIFPSYECANPSCEETFGRREAGPTCTKCTAPHCPRCGRCRCESPTAGKTCPSCNTVISPGEIAKGTHECW